MKDKLLKVQDDLYSIYEAYNNLQVITTSSNCDSGNVGAVLFVVNQQFRKTLNELDNIRMGKTTLTVIKE
ncbi:hypothetical protein [Methylomicrobium lacus]|uniref:hypothetical protein n=1 Tax=Methylomicrobium lacus TaxID=136992 RepID=UPI0035A8C315